MSTKKINKVDHVVVRFAGDSGDGMQLTGNQFTTATAVLGNDLITLPDYPAEIRAPAGTLFGVSGFQIHFGSEPVFTPGDNPDVLVAMNPAALKVNLKELSLNAVIIANQDAFSGRNLELAGFENNPLEDDTLKGYQVFPVPVTTLTRRALEGMGLTQKEMDRCKNFFALGMMFWMYTRPLETTNRWIEEKFKKRPELVEANRKAMQAGFNFADTTEIFTVHYEVEHAEIPAGLYRNLSGNEALSLGLIAAADKSGLNLFLGSYPITPASDILHELSKHKNFGVKTFQAEDEIAAINSAIGASFAGSIGVTTTSGPGVALKTEAMGLAVMTELPLVIVNVQRGGPSTGLPTKTEQADLLQAVYGRNGETPLPVIAAQSPSDCFNAAYEATATALKFMTPVILLSDGYIANGAEPWKIPDVDKLEPINVEFAKDPDKYSPYARNKDTLARMWATPGTPGLEHRIGGLEKEDVTGNVSYDSDNHDFMMRTRAEKVQNIANFVEDPKIFGDEKGDVLIVSWGSTFGTVRAVAEKLQQEGKKVSNFHLRWINPLPKSLGKYLKNFKYILVPEINLGQLIKIIRSEYLVDAQGYNVVRGLPLRTRDLKTKIEEILKGLE
jgi:2-oxoglutarate/2-oxoacid ferredoxin oxidoreductase subunit alpha